jgi:cob(I)alamin adenosyltransferase
VQEPYVDVLEQACDRYNADLEKLRSFVLPGGSPGAALLHVARTVVRRAERTTWAALEAYGETMNPLTARYLNRLSDLLFILARYANRQRGDVLWVPGGDR